MRRIVEYNLPCVLKKPFDVALPEGVEFLSVAIKKGFPKLYAIADTDKVIKTPRRFRIYDAGEDLMDPQLVFIGTFVVNDKVALHLFEIPITAVDIIRPVAPAPGAVSA